MCCYKIVLLVGCMLSGQMHAAQAQNRLHYSAAAGCSRTQAGHRQGIQLQQRLVGHQRTQLPAPLPRVGLLRQQLRRCPPRRLQQLSVAWDGGGLGEAEGMLGGGGSCRKQWASAGVRRRREQQRHAGRHTVAGRMLVLLSHWPRAPPGAGCRHSTFKLLRTSRPLCRLPSTSPAPRISRSHSATRNPLAQLTSTCWQQEKKKKETFGVGVWRHAWSVCAFRGA